MRTLSIAAVCVFALFSCGRKDASMERKKLALIEVTNKRVEKLVARLHADCDSNLLRETYKRVRQLRGSK